MLLKRIYVKDAGKTLSLMFTYFPRSSTGVIFSSQLPRTKYGNFSANCIITLNLSNIGAVEIKSFRSFNTRKRRNQIHFFDVYHKKKK